MMAAVSPILINSSSPQSFRFPSFTPPSLQRVSKDATPSSPQLPSPSTFVKPRNVGRKSGSKAQNGPDGMNVSFAGAGSPWREKELDLEAHDDVQHEISGRELKNENAVFKASEKIKESKGKLAKPQKKTKNDVNDEASKSAQGTGSKHSETTTPRQLKAVTEVRPNVYDFPTDDPYRNPTVESKAGLSFSEYAFEEINKDTIATAVIEPPKQAKKPRKRRTTAAAAGAASVEKKPKKRIAKSAAIILDSDDPDPECETDSAHFAGTENTKDKDQPALKDIKLTKKKCKSGQANSESLEPNERPLKAINIPDAGTHTISGDGDAADKSVYFTKPVMSVRGPSESTSISPHFQSPISAKEPRTTVTNTENFRSEGPASRRRRSWTPVENTEATTLPVSRPPTADSGISDTSHPPPIQLRDILGKFGYNSAETVRTAPSERTPTGEAATKRRRVELGDAAARRVPMHKVPEKHKTKRTKEPKKKAPTITALATAAFQPPKEIETNEPVISAFFSLPKDTVTAIEAQPAKAPDAQPVAVKPRQKPRKPRAKLNTAANANEQTDPSAKANKPNGARKRKSVKLSVLNERPELYSPAIATVQIRKQDFLFGTSSQLAPAESPEYIKHMQAALRESEDSHYNSAYREDSPSQIPPSATAVASPREKSCARVPTAPHGTCLSLEQAGRALWCRAARDFEGNVLHGEETRGVAAKVEARFEQMLERPVDESELGASNGVDSQSKPAAEFSIVDLCSSPPAPGAETRAADTAPEHAALEMVARAESHVPISPPNPIGQDNEDSWMVLRSDGSSPVLRPCDSAMPPSGQPIVQRASLTGPAVPAAIKSPSPRMFRTALRTLDSNAGISSFTSPLKPGLFDQVRTLASTSPEGNRPINRPRGRPRKDSRVANVACHSPKRRGRPPKAPTSASSPHRTKSKKAGAATSAAQSTAQDGWLDIDEISDSDAPITPSPPRRGASSSPPAMRPLVLSPSNSQTAKGKAPAAESGGPVLKPDGPQWPAIREALFPLITATVKSVPRSTNDAAAGPSWWERILLYDPIVVEDLTAWLNEQGLRAEVRRQKKNGKGKKRKAGDSEQEKTGAEVEWEVCDEPLQPWMVQKWCEEKGVCCYTKVGGWRRGR